MVEVLFLDFDGVIVESADIKTAAFRALYRDYGEAVVEQAVAHHMANGGISRRKKIRHCHKMLLDVSLNETELDALSHHFSRLVEDAVVNAPLVKGADTFLASNRPVRPMYVVSGTPEEELTRIVARRSLGDYFSGVHGSPREKPVIIRSILSELNVTPARCLFIGDARTDHDAAMECGIPFIGRVAEGGGNPFPPQTRIVPDLTGLTL